MPTEKITIATEAGHALEGSIELPTGLVRGESAVPEVTELDGEYRALVGQYEEQESEHLHHALSAAPPSELRSLVYRSKRPHD